MCQVAATHSGVKETPKTRTETRHHGRDQGGSNLLNSAVVPALPDKRESTVGPARPDPKPEMSPPVSKTDSAARHSGTTEQPSVRKNEDRSQQKIEKRANRIEKKPAEAGSVTNKPKVEKADTRNVVSKPPEIKPTPAKKPSHPVAETKKPESIKPVVPIRREDYLPPAPGAERKIGNLGSLKPKGTHSEQPVKAEVTEALRKTLAQILIYAADEEKRMTPEVYAKKDEEKSRLTRLHSVIFQSQPTNVELGESNRMGLKAKILNELKVIFGDQGFRELKLPTFLEKLRN